MRNELLLYVVWHYKCTSFDTLVTTMRYAPVVRLDSPPGKDGSSRKAQKAKATTIRFTEEDFEVLRKLEGHTGLKRTPAIRAAIRAMLRAIERQ